MSRGQCIHDDWPDECVPCLQDNIYSRDREIEGLKKELAEDIANAILQTGNAALEAAAKVAGSVHEKSCLGPECGCLGPWIADKIRSLKSGKEK